MRLAALRLLATAVLAAALLPAGAALARDEERRGPVVTVARGAELGAGPTAILRAWRVTRDGPDLICVHARVPYLVHERRVVDDRRACLRARSARVLRRRAMLFDCSSGARMLVGLARRDVAAVELRDTRSGEPQPRTAKLVRDARVSRSAAVFAAPVGDFEEIRALDSAGVLLARSVFESAYRGCPAPEGYGGLL